VSQARPATTGAAAKAAAKPEAAKPVAKAGAAGPAEPAGPAAGGSRWALAGRVAGGVLVSLVSVWLAFLECFLVPLRAGTVVIPVAVVLALAGNAVLPRLAVAAAGRKAAALLPPVLWLAVVFVFAAPRPEGDLIVPGTWSGLAFLFLGAIGAAYGAAMAVLPPRIGPDGTPLRRTWRP
jgi:hypothetical protein